MCETSKPQLSLRSDAGASTIFCKEAFVVVEDAVRLTNDLAMGKDISCSFLYALTADDVVSLEREAVGKVTASDSYGYRVEATDAETVSLSQVTTATAVLVCS